MSRDRRRNHDHRDRGEVHRGRLHRRLPAISELRHRIRRYGLSSALGDLADRADRGDREATRLLLDYLTR